MDIPYRKIAFKNGPKEFYCSSYKKTANRVLVLVICSNLPENTQLTFLKKLNFSRHAYKSTSSLTDGRTLKKQYLLKDFYCSSYKKTANRVLVLVICSILPENT